jgi:parvulin-like peptidyl-prolyl isomerase
MSDELPKKVFSVPPPPTDEIDSEWGGKGGSDEKPAKTATEAAEQATVPASDSGPPGADEQLKEELKGQAETAAPPGTPPPPASKEDEEDEEDEDDEDDEDEDEDEDEDDEDDEDEDEARHAARRRSHAPVTRPSGPAAAEDWIPDWAPWGMLGILVLAGLLGGLGVISRIFGISNAIPPDTATTAAAPEASVATTIEASHFLVQYKGSMRAAPTITRSKDEARKRAEEGLAKVKQGADFAKVVAEYSDEPGAGTRGGALGAFQRESMVKPFSDAAFTLKVNQVSGIVETPFGFHVIKRTK